MFHGSELNDYVRLPNEIASRERRNIRNCKGTWDIVATLSTDQSRLLITDPLSIRSTENGISFKPSILSVGCSNVDLIAEVCPNEFGLKVLSLIICTEKDPPNSVEQLEFNTAVDSGMMFVANQSLLQKCWRTGGEFNETTIVVRIFSGALASKGKEVLAEFSKIEGMEFELVDSDCYRFIGSMDDSELDIAKRISESSSGTATIVICDHSLLELKHQLEKSPVAKLSDFNSNNCGVMCYPVLGDGLYNWRTLSRNGNTVGYYCNMLGEK